MYDDQLTSASDTRQEYIRKMNSKLKTAGIIVLCALLIAIPLLVTFGKKMTVQTAGTETTASTVESKDESNPRQVRRRPEPPSKSTEMP